MPDRAKEAEVSVATQTPVIKLEKTVNLKDIFEQLERDNTWRLFEIFDRLPLDEIRKRIIRRLSDYRPHEVYSEIADGVEERIRQLRANNERDYWRGLLSWYIANSPDDTAVAVRAIEFAIAFSDEFGEEWDVAKEVSGRLRKAPGLYWRAPSMRRFIDKLISGLCFEYRERQWTQVERAIRRIVQVCDITYLPQIEKLLSLFEKVVYKLAQHEDDEFAFGQNLQFLRDTARILKQAQKEQMPDLNVAVGSYLRKRAGLTGSVIVRLEYQQESDPAKLMVPVEVVVRLELTDPTEAAKLAPVLEQCYVRLWGEGFTGTKILGTDELVRDYFLGPKGAVFNNQLWCGFSTFPSCGSNRFWLYFYDEKIEFAKVARYLIVG